MLVKGTRLTGLGIKILIHRRVNARLIAMQASPRWSIHWHLSPSREQTGLGKKHSGSFVYPWQDLWCATCCICIWGFPLFVPQSMQHSADRQNYECQTNGVTKSEPDDQYYFLHPHFTTFPFNMWCVPPMCCLSPTALTTLRFGVKIQLLPWSWFYCKLLHNVQ